MQRHFDAPACVYLRRAPAARAAPCRSRFKHLAHTSASFTHVCFCTPQARTGGKGTALSAPETLVFDKFVVDAATQPGGAKLALARRMSEGCLLGVVMVRIKVPENLRCIASVY